MGLNLWKFEFSIIGVHGMYLLPAGRTQHLYYYFLGGGCMYEVQICVGVFGYDDNDDAATDKAVQL